MYTTATVKQILDRKGHDVWSIEADSSVLDALHLMAEKNIGALLVTKGEMTVGIFSERDYARKLILQGKRELDTPVKEVMTDHVIGVKTNHKIDECLALMTGKFIRHLPVVDEGQRIVGIISIGDAIKELMAEQVFVIDQLVNYITGEKPQPAVPEKSEVEPL
jgi:CBS domain-containing protein